MLRRWQCHCRIRASLGLGHIDGRVAVWGGASFKQKRGLLFLADTGQVTMWKIFFLNLGPCCGVASFSSAAFNVSSRSLGVSLLGCCFLATGSLDNLVECIACANSGKSRSRL